MRIVPLLISPMTDTSQRRPPDLHEARVDVDAAIVDDVRARFAAILDQPTRVVAREGVGAAAVVVVAGTFDSAWEVFAFARGAGAGLDGPLASAIDAAHLAVSAVARGDRPPLDWQGEQKAGVTVFVRAERRAYAAEEAAALLLEEPPLERAIPGFPPTPLDA